MLRARYTGIDVSNLGSGGPAEGRYRAAAAAAACFANIAEKDAVDLRKYCTRSATSSKRHAARPSRGRTRWRCPTIFWSSPRPRLSPSYTMLEFQRMQATAQDYEYAFKGGDGTVEPRSGTAFWCKMAPAARISGPTIALAP